jgi:outer membrane lipoprotein-sorting protein
MKCRLHKAAAIIFAALVCTVGVRSQDAGVDARARSAIEQMHAAYKSLDALHIKVTWTARYTGDMSPHDFPLPGPEALELRMQRPNKFYMEASAKGDNGKPTRYLIVSDGTTLWHWRSATNTYIQLAAPATLADIGRLLPDDAIGTYDGVTWTVDDIMEWDLLVGDVDLTKSFAESGMALAFGAPEKIGNTAVDVVRLKSPTPSPDVPVAFEDTYYLSASSHLIQGCLMTARGKNPDTGKDFTVTMRAAYDVHETRPRFTASDFAFTPPRGAKKVDATRKDRKPSQ